MAHMQEKIKPTGCLISFICNCLPYVGSLNALSNTNKLKELAKFFKFLGNIFERDFTEKFCSW